MKLAEIYLGVSRDEFNTGYVHHFRISALIRLVQGYELFRAIDRHGDIRYGIFEPKSGLLISYLHLAKENDHYVAVMPSTMYEFRGQGWATCLYDQAVLGDRFTVRSDVQQTPEAKGVWRALHRNGRFPIQILNTKTNEMRPYNGDDEPWKGPDRDDTVLVAASKANNDINESNYGAGTSTELFWNP